MPNFEVSDLIETAMIEKSEPTHQLRKLVSQLLEQADITVNGTRDWDIQVKHESFYDRILKNPDLEIGETYMDGLWECACIEEFVRRLYITKREMGFRFYLPLLKKPIFAALASYQFAKRFVMDCFINQQSRVRARKVNEEHYNIGNDLYRLMLGPTMTYTSGVWGAGYSLEDSQNAKHELIARKLNLQRGQRVLDVGCGFGAFARYASENYQVEVIGITISTEQLRAAQALSAENQNTKYLFCDYRDIPKMFEREYFDHVVSIEMIEAVGAKNLETYFSSVYHALKPGGSFSVQSLCNINDVINTNAWFSKYIFHNGVAVSARQMDRAAFGYFGPVQDRHSLNPNYAITLREWNKNFNQNWLSIKSIYGERFKRMWNFYLESVTGGFTSEQLKLYHAIYTKENCSSDLKLVRDLPSQSEISKKRSTEGERERLRVRIQKLGKEISGEKKLGERFGDLR